MNETEQADKGTAPSLVRLISLRLCYRRGLPLILCGGLFLLSAVGVPGMGFGIGGALLFIAFASVTLLSWVGGEHRVFFTSLAVVSSYTYHFGVLWACTDTTEFRFIAPGYARASFVLVFCPIAAAWLIGRITQRKSA